MAQTNPIRTADELKDSSFNYYIAYKIDINETDVTKIEQQIKKAQSSTKGSLQDRRLLELKNDVFEVMCKDSVYDPTTGTYRQNAGGRAKEAEAAKNIKLNETFDIIKILCTTRKTLLKSEIKKIYDTANSPVVYFTETELYDRIKPLTNVGVKIIDNLNTSIPFDKYQKSEQLLKAIDKKNLYEFLGGNVTDSKQDLENKSNELRKSSQKISDLKKKQAISGLCSLVNELILSSPAAKKSYDEYLVLKDSVWSDFEKRKAFGIKELKIDEYGAYAQQIIDALKISVDEAEKILAAACIYFQQTLVGGSDDKGAQFEICPYPDCGLLYVKGSKTCPHCGKPLEVICWNCKQTTPLTKDDKGCPFCGASHRAHDVFLAKCAKLDGLINKQSADIGELQSAFLEIKNVVPNYASKPDSTIFKKAQEYEKIIQASITREETLGREYKVSYEKIRELISQKKYQSAYAIAKTLQSKYGTYNVADTKKIVADISSVLDSVQKYIDTAKVYVGRNDERSAISSAVKALEICDDSSEARMILQKFPPKPVSDLKVVSDGGKVSIEWDDKLKQEYTTYTIVKKIGVAPISPDDGALVDKGLSIKFYEDENVISATPYYYAVFAERYGVKSALRSTASPVLIYMDVANVRQDFVTSGIKASWEPPQNVKSIEVWKKVGSVAPIKAGDGTKIQCDDKGFFDEKCTGDNAYLIICNYSVKDKLIQSGGVKVVYKQYEKITSPESTNIECVGANKYLFTHSDGFGGNIALYYSNSLIPIQTDTVMKFIDFNTVCKGLTKIATNVTVDGKTSFVLPQGRIGAVYPIVFTEQLFIACPPHIVNTVVGINAVHSVANGTLCVKGALHQDASGLIIKVGNEKYPQKITDQGENFVFLKDAYLKQGKAEIKLKSNAVNYISIFVEFIKDGVKTYSQPVNITPPIDNRETVSVLYKLEYSVSAIKPFKVAICFEADSETEIPALVLTKGNPRPMNKNAGELCEKLNPLKLKKGLFSKKYIGKHVVTVRPTSANTKFAVFVSDGGERVQLKEVKSF